MNTPWIEISNSTETHCLSRQASKFLSIELILMKKNETPITSILVIRNFNEFKVRKYIINTLNDWF